MKLSIPKIHLILIGLMWAMSRDAQAQWVQQQVILKPGWNAVFLEVDPSPSSTV